MLQKLPDSSGRARRELPLQLALGQASRIKKGYSAPEVKIAFTRARALCESLGDPPELCHALYGLWMVHLLRGERTAAYDLAKQLFSQAEAASDRSLLLMANGAMGKTLFEAGHYLAVRVHLERAVSLNDREHDKLGTSDFLIPDISYLALTLCRLGYLDQALKKSQESIDSAHKIGRPFLLAFAEHFASFIREERREAHIAQEKAEYVIALSAEHGFPFWLAQATSVRGQAIAEQGRTEEGIELIREGLDKMRAIGMEASRGNHLSLLAKAVGESGRLNDAFNVLQEALATASQKGERKYEAEMHRLKGELLLRQNDSKRVDAQMCFEHAIEIARSQSAKSFELRATMSLARLLDKQSRRTEACMILSNIYNWFTEGFNTADLKDAKALLTELGD